jgi:methionyl-tRNA formyltransferase
MMQRIIPFVDHEIGYRLLQKLIAYAGAGRIEIPAVVTTRENGNAWWPGVDEICLKENIPLLIYEPPFLANPLIQEADWFLLLSWKHIVPNELVSLPKKGALNLHYSLLPAFRGVYPVNWAIINGERTTGFTYHFVNERIDGGEVFMQIEVPVHQSDTARTLQSRIDDVVCDHFDDLMEGLRTHGVAARPIKPGEAPDTVSEYYSRGRFEKACRIDLERNYRGAEFLDLLRGLTFFDDSRNAYFIDPKTGKRVFITLNLIEE